MDREIITAMFDLQVLYEDNHIIAVNKPACMLVQGDVTGDISLMDHVKEYIKVKYNKPGDVFLGLIHRIDRPVSGVVLFARTSKGASRLSEQFRRHLTQKTYYAVVESVPFLEKGDLVDWLIKDESRNVVSIGREDMAGAQWAKLSYKLIAQSDGKALLEVEPMTGRPHQIRVQLSHMGCPIVGDIKYGASAPLPDKSIALCAMAMVFETATTKEVVRAETKVPTTWQEWFPGLLVE